MSNFFEIWKKGWREVVKILTTKVESLILSCSVSGTESGHYGSSVVEIFHLTNNLSDFTVRNAKFIIGFFSFELSDNFCKSSLLKNCKKFYVWYGNL